MIKLMRTSNLWLGPFQGLVASAIGVLFVTKQKQVPIHSERNANGESAKEGADETTAP